MDLDFFNHVYVLLGLMFALTCFKVANCKPFKEEGEDFSWRLLILGLCKNSIVICGAIVAFVVGSLFGSDLLLIQLGETKVTIQSAIDLTTLAIVAVYGAKYIKNLSEFAGIGEASKNIAPANEVHNSTDSLVLDYNVPSEVETEEGLG